MDEPRLFLIGYGPSQSTVGANRAGRAAVIAILAPAAWDTYVREATPRDELVAMIGWAYGAPSLLSDPGEFYAQSFQLMDDLGMTSFWSLGGGLDYATSSYWKAFDDAAEAGLRGAPRHRIHRRIDGIDPGPALDEAVAAGEADAVVSSGDTAALMGLARSLWTDGQPSHRPLKVYPCR